MFIIMKIWFKFSEN